MAFDVYGVGLAAAALIVSVVLFIIGHKRSKKSEQVRISRYIWESIRIQYRIIHEWPMKDNATLQSEDSQKIADSQMEVRRALYLLNDDLSYFVYLVDKGEIVDSSILEYYRKQLSHVHVDVNHIMSWYPHVKEYRPSHEIIEHIKKYDSLLGKKKKYEILHLIRRYDKLPIISRQQKKRNKDKT